MRLLYKRLDMRLTQVIWKAVTKLCLIKVSLSWVVLKYWGNSSFSMNSRELSCASVSMHLSLHNLRNDFVDATCSTAARLQRTWSSVVLWRYLVGMWIRGAGKQPLSPFLFGASSRNGCMGKGACILFENVSNFCNLWNVIKVLETSEALPLACFHWVPWG